MTLHTRGGPDGSQGCMGARHGRHERVRGGVRAAAGARGLPRRGHREAGRPAGGARGGAPPGARRRGDGTRLRRSRPRGGGIRAGLAEGPARPTRHRRQQRGARPRARPRPHGRPGRLGPDDRHQREGAPLRHADRAPRDGGARARARGEHRLRRGPPGLRRRRRLLRYQVRGARDLGRAPARRARDGRAHLERRARPGRDGVQPRAVRVGREAGEVGLRRREPAPRRGRGRRGPLVRHAPRARERAVRAPDADRPGGRARRAPEEAVRRAGVLLAIAALAALLGAGRPAPPALDWAEMGAGEPRIVLVHGIGVDRGEWDAVARLLARDHRVLLVDLPGHGRSPALDSVRVTWVADALERTLKEAGVKRALLVGHSYGGLVVLDLASRSKIAQGAVVVDIGAYNPVDPQQIASVEQLLTDRYSIFIPTVFRMMSADSSAQEWLVAKAMALPRPVVTAYFRD